MTGASRAAVDTRAPGPLHREVALKEPASDSAQLARLTREARTLVLVSPHDVAAIHGAGRSARVPHLHVPVAAGGREHVPVGAEGERLHVGPVSLEVKDLLA